MTYIRVIGVMLICSLVQGCANNLMGASSINYKGGFYVERWYLNPEYEKKEIPSGTAFYGAAAEKIKYKFIIKYYVDDNKKSDVEIPESDMWIINHNGKRWSEQDDDNLFYYERLDSGEYKKYKPEGAVRAMAIYEEYLVPIQSCDNNWCKIYSDYRPKVLYVKKTILKEPLKQKTDVLNPK